ncbi:hypothetical protein F511_35583 [Dorcoceras hygrometricum]|uniref:Uncharacterized protein n=1 Tax=Dorcoceras hygrometricum TaxID=472368 RepID=A0A2Z7BLF2_9LAMI|nr:hypothetical protein F511_35583 [Dorcoceras hygrometricum]
MLVSDLGVLTRNDAMPFRETYWETLVVFIEDFEHSLAIVPRHVEDISSRKLTLSRYPSYCSPKLIISDFRWLAISCKKIAKEATLCSRLPFEQTCFSDQVSNLCAWDLVVIIVSQKVKVRM